MGQREKTGGLLQKAAVEKVVMVAVAVAVVGGAVAWNLYDGGSSQEDGFGWKSFSSSARKKARGGQGGSRLSADAPPASGLGMITLADGMKGEAAAVKTSSRKAKGGWSEAVGGAAVEAGEAPLPQEDEEGRPLVPVDSVAGKNKAVAAGGIEAAAAPAGKSAAAAPQAVAMGALSSAQRGMKGNLSSRTLAAVGKSKGSGTLGLGGRPAARNPMFAGGAGSTFGSSEGPAASGTGGAAPAGPESGGKDKAQSGGAGLGSGSGGGGGQTGAEPEPEEAEEEGAAEAAGMEEEVLEGCLANAKKEKTRCSAFKCGVEDSKAMGTGVREAYEPVKQVVLAELGAVDGEVKHLIEQQKAIDQTAAKQKYNCEGCQEGPQNCVKQGREDISEIQKALQEEGAKVKAAIGGVGSGAPSGGAAALEAIRIERELAESKMKEHLARHEQKETCKKPIPETKQEMSCSGSGDSRTCASRSVPYAEGNKAKADFDAFTEWESRQQKAQFKVIEKPWCDRHGCAPPTDAIAKARKGIQDHARAYAEFSQYIPGISGGLSQADALLTEAERLLAAPQGDQSRNLINGHEKFAQAVKIVEGVQSAWMLQMFMNCR